MITNCIYCNKILNYNKSLLDHWHSAKCDCYIDLRYAQKSNDIILIYFDIKNYSLRFNNFLNSKYYNFSINYNQISIIKYINFNLQEFIDYVKHNTKNFEENMIFQ